MSQCDPNNCDHSSHTAEPVDLGAIAMQAALKAPAAPPPQIATAASKRFDQLTTVRERREVIRAEVERRRNDAVEAPPPPAPAKPDYDPSEAVKRAQKVIETIARRKVERARLVADKLRRGVEVENELRQAMKDRDARLEAVEAKAREQLAAIAEAFGDLDQERRVELTLRDEEVSKLDRTLEQLGKQLQAEIAKAIGG
jgi:hypothetical protein